MHAPHVMDMNTPMIRKTLVAALMLALCGTAGAAGLGRINVMSTLGQPLRAEIELSASSDELDNMVVRMASADAYRRAGIDYVSALTSLKTAVEKRGNRAVVKVSSDRAFNEPFLDMLVDVTWAGGHLQREYTVLLDPEELPGPKTLNATAPISNPLESNLGGRPSQQAAASSRSPVESQSAGGSAAPGGSSATGADEYTVKKGDTLAKISSSLKSGEVTQDQMMAALYRSNSDAFVGGNINRMRVGRILKVPDAASVGDIKPGEARQIILKAHNFEGYRRAVADAAPVRDRSTGQSGQGKVASKVVEQASDAPAKDKVTVTATSNATPKASKVKAAPAGGADSAANQARLQALIDENASRQKELQEAKSRISELEQNIKEQKKLLDMKSDALAQAEARAKTAGADAAKKAPAPAAETQQAQAPAQPPAQENPAPVPASAPAEGEAAASAPEAAPAVESAPPAQIQSAPAPKPAVAPKPAEDEEDDSIFSNYWMLGGIGLILALIGIGYVVIKQRRKQASYGTGNTQLSETSTTSPNSVFGNAGGQIVDTGGTSLLHTDFSQSGMASIDTDEGVDPVAEADVYMAYGRDAQAEEILLDALKNDPRRTAVYVKLLEIYAQRRSLKQFENTATDLYTQTGGAGDDWAKAAALGLKLDPSNPLYKGAGNGGGAGLGNELAAAPQAVTAAAPKPAAVPPAIPAASNVPPARSTWTTPADVAQVSAAAPGAMPVIPEPVEADPLPESVNLDFNLDLDAPSEDDEPTQAQFGAIAKEDDDLPMMEQAVATDPMGLPPVSATSPLEFDLGFDSKSPASATTTAGVDAPQNFGTETEFDIGIETDGGHSALSEVDLEKTNFEGSLLDFDFELGDEDNKPAVDLSDVSLDAAPAPAPAAKPAAAPAPKPAAPAAAPAAPAQQVATPAAMEPIQDHIDVDEEIATKLELAKAYEEMGDVEGARELLEEVLSDGANVQKEQAKTMLSRLG